MRNVLSMNLFYSLGALICVCSEAFRSLLFYKPGMDDLGAGQKTYSFSLIG